MTSAKRFKKRWLLLGGLCAGVVFFYQPLAIIGCKYGLNYFLPTTEGRIVSYGKIQWENGAIVLSNLSIREQNSELLVDRIEFKPSGDLFRARFSPELTLIHPQVLLHTPGSNNHLPPAFLYRTRYFQPKWAIQQGVLQLPSSCFYFSMAPGKTEDKIGVLNFSLDPNLQSTPLFSVDIAMQTQGLQVDFKLEESDLNRLLPLAGLVLPNVPVGGGKIAGELALKGSVFLGTNLEIQKVDSFSFHLQKGQYVFDHGLEVTNLSAELELKPEKQPELNVDGTLVQNEVRADFHLLGKGSLQQPELELVFEPEHGDPSSLQLRLTLANHKADVSLHGDGSGFQHLLSACAPAVASDINLCGQLECDASISSEGIQVKVLGDEVLVQHVLGELALPELKEKPAQFAYDFRFKQWSGELSLNESSLHCYDPDLTLESIEGSLQWDGKNLKIPCFYATCEGIALCGSLDIDGEKEKIVFSSSQIAGEAQNLFSIVSKLDPSFSFKSDSLLGHFSSGEEGLVLELPLRSPEEAEWRFAGSFDKVALQVHPETWIKDACCDVAIDSESKLLRVENAEGIWELKNGVPLTVQIHQLTSHLEEGTLEFSLAVVDEKQELAHLDGVANPSGAAQWEIAFNSETTHFGGTLLHIQKCSFDEELGITAFELNPILSCQDLHAHAALLHGAGFLPPSFSPKNLQEWGLEGTLEAKLFSEDLSQGFSFEAHSRDLKVKGAPWPLFYISGQMMGEKLFLERLSAGALQLKGAFIVNAHEVICPQFDAEWEGTSLKGKATIFTDKKRLSCTLDSIKGNLPISLFPKGTFNIGAALDGDFSDPQDSLRIEGEANLLLDLQSLPIIATNNQTVKFTYHKNQGIVCQGIDLSIKHKWSGEELAEISAEKISQLSDLSLEKMQFSLTPAFIGFAIDAHILPSALQELEWEGNFIGEGNLQFSKSGIAFQGNLKPGIYGYKSESLPFELVQVNYEKELLSLRAKAFIDHTPLWASFQVDLAKEPYGMLKLFDHPKAEGLKVLFTTQNSKPILESIQGSCFGLTCSLAKSTQRLVPQATVFSGEIKMDGGAISPVLPKDLREGLQTLKLGSGYQWQGDLVLWHEAKKGFFASGTLTGKDFEMMDYRLNSLEATLEMAPDHFLLSQLKIEDAAGNIAIKTIELSKAQDWNLHIPHIKVYNLQPSLMKKLGQEQSELKPFTLKSFILTGIRGTLNDISSLHGEGQLQFVNQFEKETSFLDTPLDAIKKLGVDPDLLTPVQGEIQMELRGDKFYLVSLDNAFSEGARTEFYLSPDKDLSFIGLDGKMHINLKMRQDVVLKLTEAFTLTIRGTLDKPRYGLQF